MLITFIFDLFEYRSEKHTFLLDLKSKGISAGILTALLFTTLMYLFVSDPLPFVYFQF